MVETEVINIDVRLEYGRLGIFEIQRAYRNVQEILERGVVHKSLVEAVLKAGAVLDPEIMENNQRIARALLKEWELQLPVITEVLFEKLEAFEEVEMGVK